LLETTEDLFRCDGKIADADSGGVVDCVGDGCGYGDEWRFAQRFGAVGADGVWMFDQNGFDGRNVHEVGNFEGIEVQG
jgi:hypothetical protein